VVCFIVVVVVCCPCRGVAWRVAWRGVSCRCGAVVCAALRLFAVRCGAVVVSVGDGDGDVMCVCMYRCVG